VQLSTPTALSRVLPQGDSRKAVLALICLQTCLAGPVSSSLQSEAPAKEGILEWAGT